MARPTSAIGRFSVRTHRDRVTPDDGEHSWPTIAKVRSATFAWIKEWVGSAPANHEKIHQTAATQAAQSTWPADRVNSIPPGSPPWGAGR